MLVVEYTADKNALPDKGRAFLYPEGSSLFLFFGAWPEVCPLSLGQQGVEHVLHY